MLERAGVVDDKIGNFSFLCFGKLRGHASRDFFARVLDRKLLAIGETCHALFFAARDYDQAIKALRCTCFNQQRGFHDVQRVDGELREPRLGRRVPRGVCGPHGSFPTPSTNRSKSLPRSTRDR